MASLPVSWPAPDVLTPPNGASELTVELFTLKVPTRTTDTIRSAASSSVGKTAPWSP